MKTHYSFEADWRPYAFPEDESRLASEEDLRSKYTTLDLERDKPISAGGMPILSDGKQVTFDADCNMSVIFGQTGSKKSRTLIAPLITMLAQAGESMIIPDIKGELCQGVLSPQIRGILEKNKYSVLVLNFRDFDGDGYNLLEAPYRLFRSGQRSEAMSEMNDLIESFADIYKNSSADPFWKSTASQYLMAVMAIMFSLCHDERKINILSLASYSSEDSCEHMRQIAGLLKGDDNILTMLRNVVSEPERTRMCTLATVNSFFSSFLTNEKLLKMLSTSTFRLEDIYCKKTALFLVIPDEVDTYSRIVGLLLAQISQFLVREAYKFGGALPRRVNYICDEFCNYRINGMARNISAHRSRNMRWYIVCQSRKQLERAYPEADTILANCKNIYFLSSPETELLEELSARAGCTNETLDAQPKRLISVAALRGLKKGWEYTDVYFAADSSVCITKLPDISQYEIVSRFQKPGKLPKRRFPELTAFTSDQMLRQVQRSQRRDLDEIYRLLEDMN